ncbi:MAG: glycerate kinase [Ilumatobacteraceae bacterium]
MRVLAAVDKFRGTATARQVARAIADACWTTGHDCTEMPLADGGEGTLDVLGGPNRSLRVEGPLGSPVEAPWRLHRGTAVIEMALASGLQLIGGADHNDPLAASTVGTGQLIDAALNLGAERIIVCVGGSATTDGGLGAVQAISTPARLKRVDFVVACDVETLFLDAAEVFAPQKGATATQVKFLSSRLAGTAEHYRSRFGIDVSKVVGGGAAGGLAGGLHAIGARLVPGFSLVAEEVGFYDAVVECDIVVTGEGRLDETSFSGKVVGNVINIALQHGKRVIALCGDVQPDGKRLAQREGVEIVSLSERFGDDATNFTERCVREAAELALSTV